MNANTTGRQTTDRVEITSGAWAGYTGTVVAWSATIVRVRLDHSGGYHWFKVDQTRQQPQG